MSLMPTPEQREEQRRAAAELPARLGRIAGGIIGAFAGRRTDRDDRPVTSARTLARRPVRRHARPRLLGRY